MGNLCSSSSNKDDPFAQPGRTLGSAAPPQQGRTSVPKPKIQGSGRTVGGAAASLPESDPRAAAAKAAEERANKGQAKGKLAEQLAAQKKQSRTNTLEQASQDERAARAADENDQIRQWN
ncbi:hypothetical protein FH972_022132 [Carpinus fangiana]|uniref:Uncharacterized protein n=1 Tax=Carpinus fangiana TaxID=176857 RepID=A0A5N6KRP9_9ROSI|nr:hypothetical protein FH972_022132 [Carpinus fangiana]